MQAVHLKGATTCEPVPQRSRRMLQLGDSITMGMNADGPGRCYASILADLLDADPLNQGIGGHIYDPDSVDTHIPFEPDLISVAYGSNDWAKDVSIEELTPRLHRYYASLQERWSCPIIVVSPVFRKRPPPADNRRLRNMANTFAT